MLASLTFALACAAADGASATDADDEPPFNFLVDQRPALTEPTMFALVVWGASNVVAGPLGVAAGVGDALVYAHNQRWITVPDAQRTQLFAVSGNLDVASSVVDLAGPIGGASAALAGAVLSDRPLVPVALAVAPGAWLAVLGFLASLDPSSREPSVTAAVRLACDRAAGPAVVGVLALASSVGWFEKEPRE
jgi:hypothetical protein